MVSELTEDPAALGSSLQNMEPSDMLNNVGLISSVLETVDVSDPAQAQQVKPDQSSPTSRCLSMYSLFLVMVLTFAVTLVCLLLQVAQVNDNILAAMESMPVNTMSALNARARAATSVTASAGVQSAQSNVRPCHKFYI